MPDRSHNGRSEFRTDLFSQRPGEFLVIDESQLDQFVIPQLPVNVAADCVSQSGPSYHGHRLYMMGGAHQFGTPRSGQFRI
jgi:hypothetical protein